MAFFAVARMAVYQELYAVSGSELGTGSCGVQDISEGLPVCLLKV